MLTLWPHISIFGWLAILAGVVALSALAFRMVQRRWLGEWLAAALLFIAFVASFHWLEDQLLDAGPTLASLVIYGFACLLIAAVIFTLDRLQWLAGALVIIALPLAVLNQSAIDRALSAAYDKESAIASSQPFDAAKPQSQKQQMGTHDINAGEDDASEQPADSRAYRQRGKQEREAGKTEQLEEFDEVREAEEEQADASFGLTSDQLSPAYARAGWMKHALEWLLLFALAVAFVDYLSCFADTFPKLILLPISGRWTRHWLRRAMRVRLDQTGEAELSRYLSLARDRGEPVLLIDANTHEALRSNARWHHLSDIDELAHLELWPRLWFGKTCLAVPADQAGEVWQSLNDYLKLRCQTGAYAWRCVHVVIGPGALSAIDLMPARLIDRLERTHFKLVVFIQPGEDQPRLVWDEIGSAKVRQRVRSDSNVKSHVAQIQTAMTTSSNVPTE